MRVHLTCKREFLLYFKSHFSITRFLKGNKFYFRRSQVSISKHKPFYERSGKGADDLHNSTD
uniref:Uncharacterized protein n=1 Tax=Octopus bimaculoides TaxID=37653 RepID=A0A0L8GZ14_OCTBM